MGIEDALLEQMFFGCIEQERDTSGGPCVSVLTAVQATHLNSLTAKDLAQDFLRALRMRDSLQQTSYDEPQQ